MSKLNVNRFEALNRGLVETAGRIRSLQDELQAMVDELAKNQEDFRNGRLPKDSFRANTTRLTREKRRLEREINTSVRNSVRLIGQTRTLVRQQRF
jgi:hypothetical protein